MRHQEHEFEQGHELDDESDSPEVVDELLLTLLKPITVGGVDYTELQLREPNGVQIGRAQLAQRKGSEIDYVISLASQTARVPEGVVRRLCQRDLKKVVGFFAKLE